MNKSKLSVVFEVKNRSQQLKVQEFLKTDNKVKKSQRK